MSKIQITALAAAAALLVTVFFLARGRLGSGVEEARARLSETARTLTTEAESVPTGAIYQRFRLQREAVALMRADLQRLVIAESAFVADSGRPTAFMPAEYFSPDKSNLGPFIRLTFNGWWATIQNLHTPITCAIVVGADTTIGNARPGEPWCWGAAEARRRNFAP